MWDKAVPSLALLIQSFSHWVAGHGRDWLLCCRQNAFSKCLISAEIISLKPVLPSSLLLECYQHKPDFCRQYGVNLAAFGLGTGGFGVLYGKAGTNGDLRVLT